MREIKSFPFPVLSPYSADYNDGIQYSAETVRMREGAFVQVSHKLVGDSLVASLLREGAATFACVVSLPSTMYRRIFLAESREMECSQVVDYTASGYGDDTDVVESPMFRPIVVAKKDYVGQARNAGLGVLWSNNTVDIPNGAIIAFDNWARFGGEHGGLFIVQKDNALDDGQMQVSPDNTAGFRFRINVGGDLYDRLKSPVHGQMHHRKSVYTHALSAGFHILKDSYCDEWGKYINLRLITKTLEDEGIEHWTSDDFSPEKAATILYPHIFDDGTEISDDED